MLRPDEPTTIVRVIASPAFPPVLNDALRRFAADTALVCISDADVNATFLSLRARDLAPDGQLKGVAEIIGEQGAQGRALRLEIQTVDLSALRDDALRAIAVELHGILRAPIYSSKRTVPMAHWVKQRPMGWGPAGLFAQSVAPALPFGGSQSAGLAIEVGARTTIVKTRLVGASLESATLGTYRGGCRRGRKRLCRGGRLPAWSAQGRREHHLTGAWRSQTDAAASRASGHRDRGATLRSTSRRRSAVVRRTVAAFHRGAWHDVGLDMSARQVIETYAPARAATRERSGIRRISSLSIGVARHPVDGVEIVDSSSDHGRRAVWGSWRGCAVDPWGLAQQNFICGPSLDVGNAPAHRLGVAI